MTEKDIVLVPRWVHDAAFRSGHSLKDLLDYEKASKFLSKRDLASFLVLQNLSHYIVGGDSQLSSSWSLEYKWVSSCSSVTNNVVKIVDHCVYDAFPADYRINYIGSLPVATISPDILTLAGMPEFQEEVKARLFSDAVKNPSETEPFMIFDPSPELGMIVVNPGFFTPTMTRKDDDDLFLKTVRAILQLLYVYKPVHAVAQTGWYSRYLELLARRRIAV